MINYSNFRIMTISELIWKLQQLSFDKKEDAEIIIDGCDIVCVEYNYYDNYYNIVTAI